MGLAVSGFMIASTDAALVTPVALVADLVCAVVMRR
jgi:hypothetical protein